MMAGKEKKERTRTWTGGGTVLMLIIKDRGRQMGHTNNGSLPME